MTRWPVAYLPAALWAVLLLSLGSWPGPPVPDSTLPLDKLAHLLLYAVLGLLLVRGWRRAERRPPLWLPLALGLLVGAADEVNQRSVAGRSSELADWLADATGVLVAAALAARANHG